jgi:uncharacterized damage-inducible protein DinB
MPITEAWLRGPVEGIDPLLMPAAHALVQVREEVERIALGLSPAQMTARPADVASVAFHLRHIAGSIDRLRTYARGEALSPVQRERVATEAADTADADPASLVAGVAQAVEQALAQMRATPRESLTEPRAVGRAGLPSTVLGLLFHLAEHAQRHTGQALTTATIVRGSMVAAQGTSREGTLPNAPGSS